MIGIKLVAGLAGVNDACPLCGEANPSPSCAALERMGLELLLGRIKLVDMNLLNERTRRDLELDKALKVVQQHAASPLGQAAVGKLQPHSDRAGIEAEYARVRDCIQAVRTQGFHVNYLPNIEDILQHAGQATTVAPEDFLPVQSALEVMRTLKDRIAALEEGDLLKKLGQTLESFPALESFIRRSVSDKGEIRDDASPELRQLTKRCRSAEGRARKRLEGLLSSASSIVQEAVITRRGGRLVIPVKSHLRNQLDGIVQDSSGSGQTLFLEPTSVVSENNLIRELEGEIRDEKLRVLQALTDKLREESEKILRSLKVYAWIDCLYARAQYALKANARIPSLNTQGTLRLMNARHPLLNPKTVVPLDLSLGQPHQGMVITGPNTGGKTIALKTVGLLTLMAQCAIPIPADEGTQLSLFEQVRSDIGDEQSIEQNLSTFSSHLRNIVSILGDVHQHGECLSLILLDEVGAGTDPQEGTALAIALLQALLAMPARLLVTTHYSALKRFAYSHPRLKNASVEFDLETLAPTYRLLEGVPGSSNAFLIAKRLGLSQRLIDAAKGHLSQGEVRTEDVIQQLQAEHAALDQERQAFRQAKEGLEAQVKRYQEKLIQLEREHKQALSEETQRLEAELKQARQTLEEALHLRHRQEEASLKQSLRQVVVSSQQVTQARQALGQESPSFGSLEQVQVGQTVHVKGFRKLARVLEIVTQDRIQLAVDGLRVWTRLEDLRLAQAPAKPTSKRLTSIKVHSTPTPPMELNVRGLTVMETLELVDQYLNQLLLAGREQGFILHGKGTGALRRAIRDHLKTLPWVKETRSAPPAEGGDGVTVVLLG